MPEPASNFAAQRPVIGLYDGPMWSSIKACEMRYPPGSCCTSCLSPDFAWQKLGWWCKILSWAVFYRGYLPGYPPPYNCIAVRLNEGPVMISNLEGPKPKGNWIGRYLQLCYVDAADGCVLPCFRLLEEGREVAP